MDFEEGMKELEQVINQLESGEIKFNEAEKLFERGAEICKALNKNLEETKGRVSVIREELGTLIEENLQ